MSVEAPDPRTFESAEDAFKHPIPTVRGMEKKLRSAVDENRDKLRTLVGTSYRDLLGTARTIIEVDEQMQRVEALLQDTGRKSDSRILDKIGVNYAGLERNWTQPHEERLAFTSQVAILQNCLTVIARLVKANDSTILAAKLLVVARLVHKTLSTSSDAIPYLETLASRIAFLRNKLLRHVDRRLIRPNAETSVLVEDMTAFALVTSSSPTDVFRHFQHLRLESISRPIRQDKEKVKESILRRIRLFLGSLKDFRAIFPDLFRLSAKSLGARALLDDDRILEMDDLNLDIHERWLAAEVRNYTPWTRHDELQKQKVDELFKSWSEHALEVLSDRVNDDILNESDVLVLTELRREILQMWLSSKSTSYGLSTRDVLNRLRKPFLERFVQLIQSRCADLREAVCGRIINTVQNWESPGLGTSPGDILDQHVLSMDIKDGASSFKKLIVDRRSGRQEGINSILDAYQKQARLIQEVEEIIQTMKDTRWDDDFDDLDDDDTEDESIFRLLSRRDPDQLHAALTHHAAESITAMQQTLTHTLEPLDLSCSAPTSPGIFTLRTLRDLRQRLPTLLPTLPPSPTPFAHTLTTTLHASLTHHTASTTHLSFTTFARSLRPARALWDGTPPLPVLPTPATFRFLRAVVREMQRLGPDLWAPHVVDGLKALLRRDAAAALRACAEAVEEGPVVEVKVVEGKGAAVEDAVADAGVEAEAEEGKGDGELDGAEEKGDEDEDAAPTEQNGRAKTPGPPGTNAAPAAAAQEAQKVDKYVQLFFDAVYLQHALAPQTDGAATAEGDAAEMERVVAMLEPTFEPAEDWAGAGQRLRKSAGEYWRRTYLLFGLLSYAG